MDVLGAGMRSVSLLQAVTAAAPTVYDKQNDKKEGKKNMLGARVRDGLGRGY